ncbi:MAG: hypothetical protein WBB74_01250 [Gaiellaceae bacterium]
MRRRALVLALAAALLAAPTAATASSTIKYGIQDEAWLTSGTPSLPLLDERLDVLNRLGVDIVRYTLRWDRVAQARPLRPADPADPAYDWTSNDAVLEGLHQHGIAVLLTVWGTPTWANGDHKPNWAPLSRTAIASFMTAAARRYPWVRRWEIWNEPNQVGGLKPNSPRLYVKRLLNPAFDALHAVNPANEVAGGATSPRATRTALSAIVFMRGMRRAGARLDAYSHHPYPRAFGRGRLESPLQVLPCGQILTMANLQCLLADVKRDFGPKRIWLTECAYKTNPPDTWRGVSPTLQARYMGEAALRVYRASRVDVLIQFLMRDEPVVGRWASGLFTSGDVVKPSFYAFMLPFAQVSRHGDRTLLWGQVRPGSESQPYFIVRSDGVRWYSVGEVGLTSPRGYFTRTVLAGPGTHFALCSPLDMTCSPTLVVR